MAKQSVTTDKAPAAIGPYSQAIRAGGFVFASGQLPIDPATGQFAPGGAAEQAKQVLENLKAVIEAADASLADVVKTTVFLRDMKDFADVNAVYLKYFSEPFPARCCVAVAGLPKDALVEIEAIAVL